MRGKTKKWGVGDVARVSIFFLLRIHFFSGGGEGVQLVILFLQRIQT